MRVFARFSVIACLLSFFIIVSVNAQKTTGSVSGTVTDESGASVADANVTIVADLTGASRSTATSAEGTFSFQELNAGTYKLIVSKSGFKKVEERNLEVHVSDIATVTVKLPVGVLVETVTVEASSVQVETQTGTVSNIINGEQVRELPMNGRNFVQLTTLLPGAAVAENFDAKNKGLLAGVDISFSGAPANANQWRVDGANNNDIGSQRTILVYPSIDAIEEFKILRNSYGPEFGGAGGAQINIVTRGGGNDFHGSAFYFGRNDALIAKSVLLGPNDPKQLLHRNDFGYTAGGPIKKEKIFFFWSQEWNKEKRARVRAFQVPTPAELTGDFRDLAACPSQIPQDPGKVNGTSTFTSDDTATGVPNVINPARLSPAGSAFLSQFPTPNRNDPCKINWVQGVTIPVDWREENVRGDVKITKNTTLTLRYTQDSWKNPLHSDGEGGLWGEQAFPALSGNWDQPGKIAIAKLSTTIGTTATNDFSFSWSANRINIGLGGDNPGLDDTIKAAFHTVFPLSGKLHGDKTASPICWCGGESGFIGHFGPWNNGQDLYTWKDDFSKVVGRHVFRTGFYYSKNKKDEETGSDFGGLWGNAYGGATGYFDGTNNNWGGTGNEYADYLLKNSTFGYGENSTDGLAKARWSDLEFYVGDSWKVRPRLTLEYGFRWSFTPPVYDADNNYSSFRPDLYDANLGASACNGIVLAKGTKDTCPANSGGTIGTNRSLAPSNYHLIAPRLGFAWDVFGTGKFALRGGVGQFFSRDPVGILVRIESNNAPEAIAPGGERELDGNLTPYKKPIPPSPGNPGDPGNPTGALFDWSNSGAPKQGIENNTNIANNWQWNLTTETQLWRNAKLEVGWVALRGIHLNSSASLNQVAPANRLAFIEDAILNNGNGKASFLPFSALSGQALIQWNHRGDSIYHSLQATFQTRLSRNSQFQSSYTWSKNLSDTTLAYVDTTTGLADTYNPRVGRGNADFDRRHIFNASLIYNLPTLQAQHGFVKAAFGSWETATIVNLFSGAGLKVSGDVSGTWINPADGTSHNFGGNPWGIGNNTSSSATPNRDFSQPCHLSGGDRTQWLNPKAFTWTGFKLGGYPNTGIGACSGPGVQDTDFSISKNWAMPFGKSWFGEKSKIQFRMEFFNLFNHPMFRNTNLGFSMSGAKIVNNVIDCSSCTSNNKQFGVANTPSNIGNREIQYALKLIF